MELGPHGAARAFEELHELDLAPLPVRHGNDLGVTDDVRVSGDVGLHFRHGSTPMARRGVQTCVILSPKIS